MIDTFLKLITPFCVLLFSPLLLVGQNAESIWVNRNEIINGKNVTELTPEELLKYVLLDLNENSVLVSNVSFKGHAWNHITKSWTHPYDRGLSYFSHGETICDTVINGYTITWGLGMERGLLLSTAGGRDVEGPNKYADGLPSNPPSPPPPNLNDPDMNTLTTYPVKDGALLEFNFIPQKDTISFDYIFASEEYPEYVHSEYNDVFGFFISELDAAGNIIPGTTQNIALLPTSETNTNVVSINNVNNGCVKGSDKPNSPQYFPGDNPTNSEYYVANYQPTPYKGRYFEYDGRTVVLTARAKVTPGNTYHIKLGVANVSDNVLGSGVFLCAGSLNLGSIKASFSANNIHYLNLDNHTFCEKEMTFIANIEAVGLEIDSIKWYIEGIEHLPAQNSYQWDKTFDVGSYLIKLEIFPENGDIINLKGTLHIGAHITTTPLPAIGGTSTPSNLCSKVGKLVTLTATPNNGYRFEYWTTEDGTFLSSNNPYLFTVKNDSTLFANFSWKCENLSLYSTGVSQDGIIVLKWKWLIPPPEDIYGFTLFQWDNVEGWQSTPTNTDTTAKVCSAFDLAAPDTPKAIRHTDNCNKIDITSVDNSTHYRFYVRATNTNNPADSCTSNILEVINKAGLKGFYVLEDEDSVCDDNLSYLPLMPALDNQTVTYTVNNSTNYVHIQAVDSVDNLSAIFTLNPAGPLNVWVSANPQEGGAVFKDSAYFCNETAAVEAIHNEGWLFVNWTEDGNSVSSDSLYTFTVIKSRTLVANFALIYEETLDFDTYAVVLCDRIILLNLKKLLEAGYEVTNCRWFKNRIEQTDTHTSDMCSYAEESGKLLEKSPTFYSFCITTKSHDELCSTTKIIIDSDKAPGCPEIERSENLLAYPNPILASSLITIEGLVKNTPISVINYLGVCVFNIIATDTVMKFKIDLPQGIYLIGNEDKIVKILIVK